MDIEIEYKNLHLVKVEFNGGYDLVAGGRLVSQTRNGVAAPCPAMTLYLTVAHEPLQKWLNGEYEDCKVFVIDTAKATLKSVKQVKAERFLTEEATKEEVTAFLRGLQ